MTSFRIYKITALRLMRTADSNILSLNLINGQIIANGTNCIAVTQQQTNTNIGRDKEAKRLETWGVTRTNAILHWLWLANEFKINQWVTLLFASADLKMPILQEKTTSGLSLRWHSLLVKIQKSDRDKVGTKCSRKCNKGTGVIGASLHWRQSTLLGSMLMAKDKSWCQFSWTVVLA